MWYTDVYRYTCIAMYICVSINISLKFSVIVHTVSIRYTQKKCDPPSSSLSICLLVYAIVYGVYPTSMDGYRILMGWTHGLY